VTISAYKWQQLLAVHDIHYRLGQLQRWYLIATSLNNFLPTSIGGDGYRVYKTLKNPKAKSCAVLAIFVERVTGLMALLLLGYFAAFASFVRDNDELSSGFVMLGTVGIVAGLFGGWVFVRWRLAEKLAKKKFCPRVVASLVHIMGDFGQQSRRVVLVCAISFFFQATYILSYWLIIRALGSTTELGHLTIAVAMAQTVALLPISLGGLGLLDASFMYVMHHYGLSLEIGLSTVLVSRVLTLPLILLGGGFYVLGDNDRPTEQAWRSATKEQF
jgi:uncharacterized protein (TIRG00374 family)